MGWTLTLSLELYLRSIIKIASIPNLGLLTLMMKVYYSGKCKELLNALVGLLYVSCFRNPFDSKAETHWIYSSGKYVKLVHLKVS